jgi:hypothetical protein
MFFANMSCRPPQSPPKEGVKSWLKDVIWKKELICFLRISNSACGAKNDMKQTGY